MNKLLVIEAFHTFFNSYLLYWMGVRRLVVAVVDPRLARAVRNNEGRTSENGH